MKSPGLYFDIGKKARDVLYKDFAQEPKMYQIKYKDCGWGFDLSCKIQDIVPGLSALVGLVIPQSGKVELQYIRDYFGATGGFGLKEDGVRGINFSPILSFSGVVGNSFLKIGSSMAFDMSQQGLDAFNVGLSYNSESITTSLTMENLDALKATCYYTLSNAPRTALAAEMRYSLSGNEASVAIGAKHGLFASTALKGRIDTQGRVAALVQQGLWDKLFVTVGGEVDLLGLKTLPNLGFSMALRA